MFDVWTAISLTEIRDMKNDESNIISSEHFADKIQFVRPREQRITFFIFILDF